MPKKKPMRRKVVKKRRGGKIKPSQVLGSAAALGTLASGVPVLTPIAAPFAALTGTAAAISRLFGAGGLTPQQRKILKRADRQGLVIAKKPVRRRRRRR